MNTRKSTTLSLIEKDPPIIRSKGSQGFQGSFPPTTENILLQYYGYHNYLQESTEWQASIVDDVKLVVIDVQAWWKRTGIDILSCQRL